MLDQKALKAKKNLIVKNTDRANFLVDTWCFTPRFGYCPCKHINWQHHHWVPIFQFLMDSLCPLTRRAPASPSPRATSLISIVYARITIFTRLRNSIFGYPGEPMLSRGVRHIDVDTRARFVTAGAIDPKLCTYVPLLVEHISVQHIIKFLNVNF
jgi:hypothetical protein